jgi:dihydroneopterin aldolase
MTTIELEGLALHGRHGVLEEEREVGQTFLFDVRLVLADDRATRTDELADTIDYRDVVAVVREVSDGRAYCLLEALAGTVADALLARFPAERAWVRVRKPAARLEAPVSSTGVSVERRAPASASASAVEPS